jgi:hypothetical protein
MALLRALTRLIGAVWMLALALLGLGVALYCFDALIGLGSVRPDRLLHLPTVRLHVGRFLDQVAAPGGTAALAVLCGLGAMLIGVVLLIGLLRRSKQRLALLARDSETGVLAARPKTLRDMARTLAEQARGATGVKRPKVSLSRSGTRGRLTVNATRAATSDASEVQRAVQGAVEPISQPFKLKPRIRVRLGESGNRVQ